MTAKNNRLQIEKLEKERAAIRQELANLRDLLKAKVGSDIGQGEPELVDRNLIMTMIQTQERKLTSVEEALAQIQQGRYGICERCGEPIDPERLEILPETILCIKCKMMTEQPAWQRPG